MHPSQPDLVSDPPKEAVAFFDAQNLYYSAKEAWGVREPNFDPVLLAQHFCAEKNWVLKQVRFYTGVPGRDEQPRWHRYWTAKLRRLRNLNVEIFAPPLRYRRKDADLPLTPDAARWARIVLPDGTLAPRGPLLDADGRALPPGSKLSVMLGEEKGVDVRLALDLVRLTLDRAFDVGLLFTQDQDHAVAVREAKAIAASQARAGRYALFSLYPAGTANQRGVEATTWVPFVRGVYFACADDRDYFGEARRR